MIPTELRRAEIDIEAATQVLRQVYIPVTDYAEAEEARRLLSEGYNLIAQSRSILWRLCHEVDIPA